MKTAIKPEIEFVDLSTRLRLLSEAKRRLADALRPHIDLRDVLEVIPVEGILRETPDDNDNDLLDRVDQVLTEGHVDTIYDLYREIKGRLDALNRIRKAA